MLFFFKICQLAQKCPKNGILLYICRYVKILFCKLIILILLCNKVFLRISKRRISVCKSAWWYLMVHAHSSTTSIRHESLDTSITHTHTHIHSDIICKSSLIYTGHLNRIMFRRYEQVNWIEREKIHYFSVVFF